MCTIEGEFWDIVHLSMYLESAGEEETLAYCRGTLAYAMDLIEEERFKEANRKLMGLNYYIDCVASSQELQEIYDTAWSLIHMLDEPDDPDTDDNFGFTIPIPNL